MDKRCLCFKSRHTEKTESKRYENNEKTTPRMTHLLSWKNYTPNFIEFRLLPWGGCFKLVIGLFRLFFFHWLTDYFAIKFEGANDDDAAGIRTIDEPSVLDMDNVTTCCLAESSGSSCIIKNTDVQIAQTKCSSTYWNFLGEAPAIAQRIRLHLPFCGSEIESWTQ